MNELMVMDGIYCQFLSDSAYISKEILFDLWDVVHTGFPTMFIRLVLVFDTFVVLFVDENGFEVHVFLDKVGFFLLI